MPLGTLREAVAATCLLAPLLALSADEPPTAETSAAEPPAACSQYLNTKPKPTTIEKMLQVVSKMPSKKGEYESTVDFNARVAKASSTLPAEFVVASTVDPKFVTYDADTAKLTMQGFALKNINADYSGVFGIGDPLEAMAPRDTEKLDVVFPLTYRELGTYRARNAFGAEIVVTRVQQRSRAVFSKAVKIDYRVPPSSWPTIWMGNSNNVYEREMPPEEARRFKTTTKAAFVFVPKAPFYIKATNETSDPTMDNPYDRDATIEVAFADIKCALLMGPDGTAFAVVKTRP